MSNPATPASHFAVCIVLAASLALALAACATPVLKPSLDVPDRFAAAIASPKNPRSRGGKDSRTRCFRISSAARRSRIATSGSRPSGCGLRAAERRSAGRGSFRPSGRRRAFDHKTNYDSVLKNFVPEAANTRAAQGAVGVTWEVDLFGRLRAGAAAAAADTLAVENGVRGVRLLVLSDVAANYFTLKGALKQLETVRAISAAQDETARLVTARQRVGLATPFDVERAQTEASEARAAIPPLETLAAVSRHRNRRADCDQAFRAASIAPSTSSQPFRRHVRANPPRCCSAAGPACGKRAARRRECAHGNRQWRNGSRGVSRAPFSSPRASISMAWPRARALHQRRGLLAMPIFNAGRTQAINDMRKAASAKPSCATRTRSRVPWKDVENTLVALADETATRAGARQRGGVG
jgi:hypothetical protein